MATRNRRPRATPIRALGARYDAASQRVELELTNGYVVGVPVRQLTEIASAPATQLAGVEVIGAGNVLHWESLDADYSVPAILAEGIGRHVAMRLMAGAGGRARSKAKVAAARVNGRKGGRPRRRA